MYAESTATILALIDQIRKENREPSIDKSQDEINKETNYWQVICNDLMENPLHLKWIDEERT